MVVIIKTSLLESGIVVFFTWLGRGLIVDVLQELSTQDIVIYSITSGIVVLLSVKVREYKLSQTILFFLGPEVNKISKLAMLYQYFWRKQSLSNYFII